MYIFVDCIHIPMQSKRVDEHRIFAVVRRSILSSFPPGVSAPIGTNGRTVARTDGRAMEQLYLIAVSRRQEVHGASDQAQVAQVEDLLSASLCEQHNEAGVQLHTEEIQSGSGQEHEASC